ncbi:TIM barrel protein [Methanocella sp. MCL-LM]|uniref:TIM barrel protein n=1 Tax=Methanocella sp. MCL-LM TaxID=3412035 RepID=UPI003C749C49
MPDVLLQLRTGGRFKEYIRAFDVAERSGFDGVEIDTRSIGSDAERMHLLSLEHGLPIKSLIAQNPLHYYLFDNSGDYEVIDEIKPEVVVFKTPRASLLRWPLKKLFADQISKYSEQLGKHRVAIENTQRNTAGLSKPLFNIKGLRDFVYEHDISVNFDVSDCAASGMDILLSCDMLIPRIKNVHFSDYGGHASKGHIFPGFGLLPLGLFLSRLREYKYNGLITLEVDPRDMPFDSEDHITLYSEIIGFIKSYFK